MLGIILNLIEKDENVQTQIADNGCRCFGKDYSLTVVGAGNTALLTFFYYDERLYLQVPIDAIKHLMNKAIRDVITSTEPELLEFLKNTSYKRNTKFYDINQDIFESFHPRKETLDSLDLYCLSFDKNQCSRDLYIPAWEIQEYKFLERFVTIRDYSDDMAHKSLKQKKLKELFKPYTEAQQIAALTATSKHIIHKL